MDQPIVAVAADLTPVRRALEERGYRVVPLESAFEQGLNPSAFVVSGVDDGVLGIDTVEGRAPVIDAAGRSAAEVAGDVERAHRLVRRP